MGPSVVPTVITLFRLFLLPVIVVCLSKDMRIAAFFLWALAGAGDAVDGWLARRLNAVTSGGALLDVIIDFLSVFTVFVVMAVRNLYPYWLLPLILFMFGQFLLTSPGKTDLLFDPVGRYFGTFLSLIVGLSLLFPNPVFHGVLKWSVPAAASGSFCCRTIYLIRGSAAGLSDDGE